MQSTGTLKVTTPTEREIVLTRIFDAPRNVVFDALTKPELLTRWYGPRSWSLVVSEVDLKVGGAWRFVLRGPDGADMGMRGVYREIAPPDRLVSTEAFDDYPDESLATIVLVEDGGRTTFTNTLLYPSRSRRGDRLRHGTRRGRDVRAARRAPRVDRLGREFEDGTRVVRAAAGVGRAVEGPFPVGDQSATGTSPSFSR